MAHECPFCQRSRIEIFANDRCAKILQTIANFIYSAKRSRFLKKPLLLFFVGLLANKILFSQNPIVPAGTFIADPTARVWHDRKLYVYGSLDESCNYYCSHRHHVLVTEDLKKWTIIKNVLMSRGASDAIAYNNHLLYAPDCAYKNGTYYLYYCQPSRETAEGVAVSPSPIGPFLNGQPIDLGGHNQIDPCVFIDDDGQAYYLWGQFSLKMAKLKSNMKELDLATLKDHVLTENEHYFHEGAFLSKRDGIYYLIFADLSRGDIPTCIGYATSNKPFGPYTYRGVIIDNNHCNPGNWNNHGSIVEFKGKWYVFYHRSSHGCKTMRKACVEPIQFKADGSIPEVEMTSQGAGDPLDAYSVIEAERACILNGHLRLRSFSAVQEELGEIRNGDMAGFKYVDFKNGAAEVAVRVASGAKGGKIIISVDKPWHQQLGSFEIEPGKGKKTWRTFTFGINPIVGVHAVWLQFYGEEGNLFDLDWLKFKKKSE